MASFIYRILASIFYLIGCVETWSGSYNSASAFLLIAVFLSIQELIYVVGQNRKG